MKLISKLVANSVYHTDYIFPEEVWLDYKDTVRDNSDFPDHDEDIRFEYGYDFMCWLEEQIVAGDNRITTEERTEIINGDYKDMEWAN